MTAVFQELVEPERIVFLSQALDANGKPIFEVLNTITLTAQAGPTKLTLHAKVTKATLDAPRFLAGMKQGWTETLERLTEHVASA